MNLSLSRKTLAKYQELSFTHSYTRTHPLFFLQVPGWYSLKACGWAGAHGHGALTKARERRRSRGSGFMLTVLATREGKSGVPQGRQVARCVEVRNKAPGEWGRRCPRTGPGKQNRTFPCRPAAPSAESKLFSWENAPFSMWRSSSHRALGGGGGGGSLRGPDCRVCLPKAPWKPREC